jgi:ribonuclease-3
MSAQPDLELLQRRIGYQFKSQERLLLALTHRSFGNQNNERLEFLGDSIVNMVIAEHLFRRFPKAREGQLSRLRARMVKGVTLAEIGREFDLGSYLRLGSGELKSGGFRRESILADAVESIIGAVYLDSDFATCQAQILQWFDLRLQNLDLQDTQKDPKTRLQEYLQSRQFPLPIYDILSVDGEAHSQTFHISCALSSLGRKTTGSGNSRRIAEQQAARNALKELGVEND